MREHLYSVYIMASLSGALYIGVTSDLQTRVRQHKAGTFEGFSKKYRCHRLVYYERYDRVQSAIGREKQLKRTARARKIKLIETMNPRWRDLSELWGREFLVRGQSTVEADEAKALRAKLPLHGSSAKSLATGMETEASREIPRPFRGLQDDSS
jgi:putative endonuclease